MIPYNLPLRILITGYTGGPMNSKSNPFTVKIFEACTSHITKQDDQLLKREDLAALAVYEVKSSLGVHYGYLIYTGVEEGSSVVEDNSFSMDSLRKAGFSEAIINLLDIARKKECKFLQLDCDGVEYDDLPTFNW